MKDCRKIIYAVTILLFFFCCMSNAWAAYTNVNFTAIGGTTNGYAQDGSHGSSDVPEITLNFIGITAAGTGYFKVYDTFAPPNPGASGSYPTNQSYFMVSTLNNAKDFDILQFDVYNPGVAPVSLDIDGWSGIPPYPPTDGDVVANFSATAAAGAWTTVTLTGFKGISSLTIDFPDNTPLYFNQFHVQASAAAPTVTTTAISSITSTTASGGGNVASEGDSAVTARGVCWSTSANPTTADSKTSDGTGGGDFSSSITGLNPGTTYHVRAFATNSAGTTYGNDVSFTTSSGTEPTDILLSNTSVNENQPQGTSIGTLSSVPSDGSYFYSLASGTGDTNNGSFSIKVNDAEDQNSGAGSNGIGIFSGYGRIWQSFTAGVTGPLTRIMLKPTSGSSSSYTIKLKVYSGEGVSGTYLGESTATLSPVNGYVTWNFSGIFLISGQKYTFELTDWTFPDGTGLYSWPDSTHYTGGQMNYSGYPGYELAFKTYVATSSELITGSSFDYETKSAYDIRLRTTNSLGQSFEKPFTITVNNANETPTDILLSASSVDENVAGNTTVGTLNTTDPDAANTFNYSLVSGTGSTDNASFDISGNSLIIKNSPDYETNSSYSVRVRSTDQGGLTFDKAFTITINNVNDAPEITNLNSDNPTIAIGASGYLDVGQNSVLTDVDSPNFLNGTLQTNNPQGPQGSFLFDGVNVLSGNDGIISRGEEIRIDGQNIGVVDQLLVGNSTQELKIYFSLNATPQTVQTLLRHLKYSPEKDPGNQTIQIIITDGNGGTVSKSVTVNAISPEMSVAGNSTEIADGDTTPSTADHTDFGNVDIIGSSVVRTFTIKNTGTNVLNLNGTPRVSIGGANADQFSVTTQPSSSSISPAGSLTFQVTFDPSSVGAKTAEISIANDDSDENPYNFSIQGTGTIAPVMSIEGNSTAIANGDNSPSASDHTDFGTTAVTGGTVQRTFTIKNTGSAALNMTGTPKVEVTGANSSEFTVSSQPVSPIAATSGTSTFTVTFDPAGAGTRTATISIANDTTGTNPYTFAISGSGLCGIPVTPTSGLTTTESGGTATFTVVLDCAPTANVTVNLSSSDTLEGTVSPSSLTFTPANWNTPQTVTVTGVDDATYDGNKSYQIITSAATSTDANYNGIDPSDVSVTNTDNESAPPPPQPPTPSNPEVGDNNQVIGSGTTLPNNTDHTGVTVAAGGTVINNATLTDLTNRGTVTGGTVSGDSENQGLLSGVTLSSGTNLDNAGGTVTGSSNNGTIYGGTISGTITNTGTISGLAPGGTIDPSYSVTISPGAVVSGGQINGSVTNLGTLNNVTIGAGTTLSFTNGSGGQTGRLTGTVTFMTESGTGCVITIPTGVVFPEPGSIPQEGFVLTPEMLFAYANEHGWDVASRAKAAKASAGLIPEILGGHVLVGGIVLSETGSKSSSEISVSIPYAESLIPEGYSADDIKAMAYDYSENTWITVPSTRSGENALKISTKLITAYAAVVKINTPPVQGTISVSQISGDTSENRTIATFTVVLGSAPSSDVTIGLTSSDLTEGVLSTSSLVFTPENWNIPQTVSVIGADDDVVDGDQSYFIVTGASVSDDPAYNGIDPSDISVVNTDNDTENVFTPGQVSPENGAVDVSMTPILTVMEPGAINGFATHAKTQWQVSKTSDFAPFDLVFSLTGSGSLCSVKVPYLALTPDTQYFWRARFIDDQANATEWSQASSFWVVSVNPDDMNNNGVADVYEIGAATDLDANGTDDASQTDMLRTQTSTGDVMIGVKKTGSIISIESAIAAQQSESRAEEQPLGLLEIRASVSTPGAETEILLHSSKSLDNSAGWSAFSTASGWYDYSSNVIFSSDGKCVTVKLKDGGYGDDDGCSNGIIIHKAALPKAAASVVDPVNPDSGSGGGGSCFIEIVSSSQRSFPLWLLAALAASLLIGKKRTR